MYFTNMDMSCVVQDIEGAIQLLTTTDCESNLNAIKRLEEASYRLWVESNTAFLDESFVSTCTDDESWMWDEECFFDSHPNDVPCVETSLEDDESSLCTSTSHTESSFCDTGYIGDVETSLEHTTEENKSLSTIHKKGKLITRRVKQLNETESAKTSDEVPNEHECDDNWVIVEGIDRNCHVIHELPMTNVSLHKEIVQECSAEEDSDTAVEDDEEDWTILSLKITEIQSANIKVPDMNSSRDSGIISSDTPCSHKKTIFDRFSRGYEIHEQYR